MRISLAALALGISAVMVPSSAHAYTATFEVEDYTTDTTCVDHTFDLSLDTAVTDQSVPLTIGVTDPNGAVVHTLRTEMQQGEQGRNDVEMVFCRAELVSGVYTIDGVFGEPTNARRALAPETFTITRTRVPVVTPTPETSSVQTGWVRVSKVARGTKVVFRAGTADQVWKVRVKGTTRRVKLEAGDREVKVYRGARSVRIKTLGQRVY